MGVFALVYAECTGRVGANGGRDVELRVAVFSACLSIVVGVAWIVLAAMGTLDGYFGP